SVSNSDLEEWRSWELDAKSGRWAAKSSHDLYASANLASPQSRRFKKICSFHPSVDPSLAFLVRDFASLWQNHWLAMSRRLNYRLLITAILIVSSATVEIAREHRP